MAVVNLQYPFATLYPITQDYGATGRSYEYADPRHGGVHWHDGIDLGAPFNTVILAAGAGTVTSLGWDTTGFGNLTKIDHGNGVVTWYAHQGTSQADPRFIVSLNDVVKAGQPIGHVGYTGNVVPAGAAGAHLHFTVRVYGADQNPLNWISVTAPSAQVAPANPDPTKTSKASTGGGVTLSPGTVIDTSAGADPTLPPPIGADPSPLNITQVALRALRPGAGVATTMLWIDGAFAAVLDASVTLTALRTPGQFSATLSLDWLQRTGNTHVIDRILAKGRAQAIVYMGYVPSLASFDPSALTPVFTGLIEGGDDFDYNAAQRTLTVSGPDLSALLSTQNDTAAQASVYANMAGSTVAQMLAKAHNLGYRGTATAGVVGDFFSSDTLVTRTSGQTEWDILTQLADALGYICYIDGTTLVFDALPTNITPYTAYYQKAGFATTINRVRVRTNPHAKREYRIVAQSYDTSAKAAVAGEALSAEASGDNPDSTQQITITMAPGTPLAQLQQRANSVLAAYSASEVLYTLYAQSPLAIARNQPITLASDEVWQATTGPIYPVSLTYEYSRTSALITTTVVCTSRPWGIQTAAAPAPLSF